MTIDTSTHLHYIFWMKNTTLQIRLDPSEKEAFERAAELSGIALSSWVRERLRRVARAELIDANQRVPFLQANRASE
jgi:uncharacterized protein (DUF1778 family)